MLLAAGGLAGVSPARAVEPPSCRLAFVQVAPDRTPDPTNDLSRTLLAARYLPGMRVVVANGEDIAGTLRSVSEGFACATDPAFSPDGSRLVFSGRRGREDRLRIWEANVNGGDARLRVEAEASAVRPAFHPDGRILFASSYAREYEEHGDLHSLSLFAVAEGGTEPERLTFNPSSDFDPVFLADGRILYSSWQHVGNHSWPRGNVALMLVNSDGTGIFPLTGNHRGPWMKRGATPFGPDGVAFVRSDGTGEFGSGELVATSLNDPFAPYRTLLPRDRFEVADATELPDGALLVSARPADGSAATFGLWVLRGESATLLFDDPTVHDLAPAAGFAKEPPDRRISAVVPGTPYGYLLVLDCRQTDRTDARERIGSAVRARILEGIPLRAEPDRELTFHAIPGREGEPLVGPTSATGAIPTRILGEVPLSEDGSVYVKVPADRPIRFQLLDAEGFVAVDERAWHWVRPNERRVCIGCHENRETAPENRAALAARLEPVDLSDESGARTVTFVRDIHPILEKNCAVLSCHSPPDPTAAMNFSDEPTAAERDSILVRLYGPAYANLLARQNGKPPEIGGRRVHPGDARRSPLLWMLYGRALAPQYAPAPFDRPLLEPHPGPARPAEELDRIKTWIDLGAPYDDPPVSQPTSSTQDSAEGGEKS